MGEIVEPVLCGRYVVMVTPCHIGVAVASAGQVQIFQLSQQLTHRGDGLRIIKKVHPMECPVRYDVSTDLRSSGAKYQNSCIEEIGINKSSSSRLLAYELEHL